MVDEQGKRVDRLHRVPRGQDLGGPHRRLVSGCRRAQVSRSLNAWPSSDGQGGAARLAGRGAPGVHRVAGRAEPVGPLIDAGGRLRTAMKLAGRAGRGDPRDHLADSFLTHLLARGSDDELESTRGGASTRRPRGRRGVTRPRLARSRSSTISRRSVMIGDPAVAARPMGLSEGAPRTGRTPRGCGDREVREERPRSPDPPADRVHALRIWGTADAAHRKRVYWFLAESDANTIRSTPVSRRQAVSAAAGTAAVSVAPPKIFRHRSCP